MNAQEIRTTFLEFFTENDHRLVSSSPVVPQDDPTLLFANAGMNQFKGIFTGEVKPEFPRATTVQKCIRAGGKHNDLDNVGYTSRHLTFFEMLGNFSFGDYFKEDAIRLAWKLVVETFELPTDRLIATVFHEDEEARELWQKISGLPRDRIVGLGEKDNYWSMGDVGPCGPCSEILFDRGDDFGEADLENGERFFEIWNLVFMQFEQTAGGDKIPLPRPSIDTGMGLERIAMVLQDARSVFEIDLLRRIIARVEELTGAAFGDGEAGVPHRVLADHIRTLVFALADGAHPSNEGRGYVLRRILRRAARYARKIHDGGPILHDLVGVVLDEMGDAYPEIRRQEEFVVQMIRSEEERFGQTLDHGIELFDETVAQLEASGGKVISGADVFRLYDTFGFPVDLVEVMADEKGLSVDLAEFERRMAAQKEQSQGSSKFSARSEARSLDLAAFAETEFCGYDETATEAEVLGCSGDADALSVVLSRTPFYGESGGQVGDAGRIRAGDFELEVLDTKKERGRFIHECRLASGDLAALQAGSAVEAEVDSERRASIARNHSATHLLHAALREVAGTHVRQKGSLVGPSRLRFDVTHFAAFTAEETSAAEELVREQILADTPVEIFETDYDDAVARGAIALFGEKYGDRVRVVRMGDFSMELCGGTHVASTGQIGPFVVIGEASVSSGVRRLEALTAEGTEAYHRGHYETLLQLARLLKVAPDAVTARVERLLSEQRELRDKLKRQAASSSGAAVNRDRVGDALVVSGILDDAGGKELRERYDAFKGESERVVAVLIGTAGGKLGVLVGVSRALVDAGVDARKIFGSMSEALGARGGGRPELVQAGGSLDGAKLEPALEAARAAVAGAL